MAKSKKENYEYQLEHRKSHYEQINVLLTPGTAEKLSVIARHLGHRSRNDYIKAVFAREIDFYMQEINRKFYDKAVQTLPAPTEHREKIFYAIKTTGANTITDEIIQLAIIDEHKNILIDITFAPQCKETWELSDYCGTVTPDHVKNLQYVSEQTIAITKGIFQNTDCVISYAAYNEHFLHNWDVSKESTGSLILAKQTLTYNPATDSYSSKSIREAAEHYQVECNTDTALDTAITTLEIYQKMTKDS